MINISNIKLRDIGGTEFINGKFKPIGVDFQIDVDPDADTVILDIPRGTKKVEGTLYSNWNEEEDEYDEEVDFEIDMKTKQIHYF